MLRIGIVALEIERDKKRAVRIDGIDEMVDLGRNICVGAEVIRPPQQPSIERGLLAGGVARVDKPGALSRLVNDANQSGCLGLSEVRLRIVVGKIDNETVLHVAAPNN